MQVVDLSHVMNVHTPGWVGYAGNKMYYAQNLQTQMIVAQRIETALHVGTHFDGAMHATDGRGGDMASLGLDYLIGRGTIVDLSDQVTDWTVITPEMIMATGADIRDGDSCCIPVGTGSTRVRVGRIWCAISVSIPDPASPRCIGCWRRKSNGSRWTPAHAITR
jgi:kynurenine formamidase